MTGAIGSGQNILVALQKWFPHILIICLSYCAADLTILYLRQYLLPQASTSTSGGQTVKARRTARSVYAPITKRNIFNEDGVIPPELTADGEESLEDIEEADPVPSQLPLNLLGTIVHGNPERSVATIDLKGRNRVKPYQIGDEIEGMAEITEINRRKVIFRNLRNAGRLEYIELKLESKIRFGNSGAGSTPVAESRGEVKVTGDNKFEISRDDILKYTNDLPSLLQQARAVPNRDPRTGEVDGFRVLDIKQNSIFEKLGVQRMDIIKSVNGEPVNSPKKAMELYQALRNESKIAIGVERNGRSQTLDYTIK